MKKFVLKRTCIALLTVFLILLLLFLMLDLCRVRRLIMKKK